jgi:four helix bundle protein
MDSRELENRTKAFAIRCLKLVDALPNKPSCRAVASQLARSATSIGANYRAAARARSKAEWLAKLCIVIEESDESAYWLEIIAEAGMLKESLVQDLRQEANELLMIFSKSRSTARMNQITKSPNNQIAK